MEYLANVVSSALSVIFIVFAIAALGYLVGSVKIKGISLGTAGVLLVALIFGICISFIPGQQFLGLPPFPPRSSDAPYA